YRTTRVWYLPVNGQVIHRKVRATSTVSVVYTARRNKVHFGHVQVVEIKKRWTGRVYCHVLIVDQINAVKPLYLNVQAIVPCPSKINAVEIECGVAAERGRVSKSIKCNVRVRNSTILITAWIKGVGVAVEIIKIVPVKTVVSIGNRGCISWQIIEGN